MNLCAIAVFWLLIHGTVGYLIPDTRGFRPEPGKHPNMADEHYVFSKTTPKINNFNSFVISIRFSFAVEECLVDDQCKFFCEDTQWHYDGYCNVFGLCTCCYNECYPQIEVNFRG